MSDVCDIAVIGGGLTGLVAAHHAALSGAKVLHVIGTGLPGGLAANVGALDGFPAVADPVSALDIALRLTEQNDALGVDMIAEDVSRIGLDGATRVLDIAGDHRFARAVIVATGARLKMLDAPGAQRLFDRGVSQCAWCNGSLHKNQDVVVVGGGDAALQDALHLAEYAASITILTRGDQLRARRTYIERAMANETISIRPRSEVVAIHGDDAVTGVRVRSSDGGELELPCSGVFVSIGLTPNAELIGDLAQRDARGFILTNADLETATPGIFAAGAVRSGYSGRLTSAMGEGTSAALAAWKRVGGVRPPALDALGRVADLNPPSPRRSGS